ncbi:MAG: tRNA uridine-5-carboxymethylaminomethyl(34) synthesis enzyme MnmG, partial [Clostridiales bacterium]|nr:tRNA uridine-5-carboxymethylaminomethyl(34) synthesis enzyme MnmG [Clostridiales bacterium]
KNLAPTPELCKMLLAAGTTAPNSGVSLANLLRRPQISYKDLSPFDTERPKLSREIFEQVEISLKYAGYIDRQIRQVKEFSKMENRRLPRDLNYEDIKGLRIEARQKLNKIRPENLGQAGRISGVSPADMAALMVYLEGRKENREQRDE